MSRVRVLTRPAQAANVLVNDKTHCVISDFGQSEMKSEAYRVSGMPLPRKLTAQTTDRTL